MIGNNGADKNTAKSLDNDVVASNENKETSLEQKDKAGLETHQEHKQSLGAHNNGVDEDKATSLDDAVVVSDENNEMSELEPKERARLEIYEEKDKNCGSSGIFFPLISIYVASIGASLMLGWIAGYFSLNNEPVMTIGLIGMVIGIIMMWCLTNGIKRD